MQGWSYRCHKPRPAGLSLNKSELISVHLICCVAPYISIFGENFKQTNLACGSLKLDQYQRYAMMQLPYGEILLGSLHTLIFERFMYCPKEHFQENGSFIRTSEHFQQSAAVPLTCKYL